jgi:phenylpropionate dioxygenase-like ring-hydroxylating dioxygenase large terminal subunit
VLRRYWHPVGCSEWVTTKPQRIKMLGEELMLYRGQSGRPALMQLRCAHRSVALDYGRVKGDSIRCPYHGWLYDATGQCLEQPAEPAGSRYKDEIRMRAYPTQEMGGLVFGYMGPEPAPLLPLYDLLRREDGVKMIQVGNVSANWMNHVDNIVDISHLAWLHGYTFRLMAGSGSPIIGSAPNPAPTACTVRLLLAAGAILPLPKPVKRGDPGPEAAGNPVKCLNKPKGSTRTRRPLWRQKRYPSAE